MCVCVCVCVCVSLLFFFLNRGLSLSTFLCIDSTDSLSYIENTLHERKYRGRENIWTTSVLHLSSKKNQKRSFPLTWAATFQSKHMVFNQRLFSLRPLDDICTQIFQLLWSYEL